MKHLRYMLTGACMFGGVAGIIYGFSQLSNTAYIVISVLLALAGMYVVGKNIVDDWK